MIRLRSLSLQRWASSRWQQLRRRNLVQVLFANLELTLREETPTAARFTICALPLKTATIQSTSIMRCIPQPLAMCHCRQSNTILATIIYRRGHQAQEMRQAEVSFLLLAATVSFQWAVEDPLPWASSMQATRIRQQPPVVWPTDSVIDPLVSKMLTLVASKSFRVPGLVALCNLQHRCIRSQQKKLAHRFVASSKRLKARWQPESSDEA